MVVGGGRKVEVGGSHGQRRRSVAGGGQREFRHGERNKRPQC